jgi:hypothetical protein
MSALSITLSADGGAVSITLQGNDSMNTLVKAAIAGALSLSATTAFANISAPWTNTSDLVLVVENATTHNAYALDLGVTIDQLMPTSSLVANATLSTSIQTNINQTILASATLQSFLAANPASGDLWTLEGGQYNGGGVNIASASNTRPAAAAKMVITSNIGTTNNQTVSGKQAANLAAFENGLQTDIHAPTNPPGLQGLETATETSSASTTAAAEGRYSFLTANDFSSLGSSTTQLFGFTGNNTSGILQSYILGTASLSTAGTLTFSTGTAPTVPLPAAVWLFGSGLLGLFGVSRRRAVVA